MKRMKEVIALKLPASKRGARVQNCVFRNLKVREGFYLRERYIQLTLTQKLLLDCREIKRRLSMK